MINHLGHEYRGKLPPGREEQLSRSLKSYRRAQGSGALMGLKILAGPGCAVSESQQARIYSLATLPSLPLPGCNRSPFCGCCYSPVLAGFS
jgi:hypothetical protein